MSRYGWEVRIEHDGGPLEPRRDFREQLKPFASQRGFAGGKAGGVSTRAVEPRNDAAGLSGRAICFPSPFFAVLREVTVVWRFVARTASPSCVVAALNRRRSHVET